jgi:hypothetical protein
VVIHEIRSSGLDFSPSSTVFPQTEGCSRCGGFPGPTALANERNKTPEETTGP